MPTPRGVSSEEATPRVADQQRKPKPKPKPAQPHPLWWHLTPQGISNNLRYEARRLQRVNAGYRPTGAVMGLGLMAPGSMYAPLQYQDPKGRVRYSTPAQRDIVYGATARPVKAVANLAINTAQRVTNGWKPADPASTPVGRVIEQADRAIKSGMDIKQDWERSPDDLLYQQIGADLTTSVIGGWAAKGLVPAAAFTQGAFRTLSPAAQQALRWTTGTAIESGTSTLLTDNRQGNLANAAPGSPFAVQPTDDMVSALGKSLLPNAGGEVALGLGFLGLGKALGTGIEGLNNVTRRQAEGRVMDEVVNARQFTKEAGLQDELDGEFAFTDQAQQPAAAPAAAPAAPAAPVNQRQAEDMLLGPKEEPAAPEAPAEAAAPEAPVYGPELPEVDAAVMAANRLDDEHLIAAAQGSGPVLPELERQMTAQEDGFTLQSGLAAEPLSAPTENVAAPLVPFRAQWEAMPYATVKSLAHFDNNPELFRRVQMLSGRDWPDFTHRDVLDGIDQMAQEGRTVIPNRVAADATVLPVEGVQVDPTRFQYKDNVDAEGRQKGNSLEGVKQYSTDLEGRVDVWEDPADGQTYVVNGHNRLALARSKGVGGIRVNYLTAQTAEQARALGALTNIAQGAGTPFDAAKAIREMGITDPAGLEAAGIPLQSGLGAQGLALSKLPDNLFQQAVNGELTLGRALSLGGSGMDAEGMTRVVQLAAGKDMTDRAFSELTQMASTAPKVESDQMGLFGAEQIDTTIIKAELAGKVRAELIGNKNLFSKVGKAKAAQKLAEKGGTEVNQGQVATAAQTAQAVLGEFDSTKYAAGTPLSQLLNDGAAEIAGGAKQAVVVRRILQQLEAAAQEAPPTPKEVPTTSRTEQFWAEQDPEWQDRRAEEARALLLSDQKLASRQKAKADYDANTALVATYLDEMPGSNSGKELSEKDFLTKYGADESKHPKLPKSKALPKPLKELDEHLGSERYLAWYEANRAGQGGDVQLDPDTQSLLDEAQGIVDSMGASGKKNAQMAQRGLEASAGIEDVNGDPVTDQIVPSPLTPEARKQLKAEVIKRAIQNGEVRPSSTPLPDLPDPPSNLTDPEALLRDEARLAEEYGVQDTIEDQLRLDAQRKAMGWDGMSLEEKKANGMLDEWQKPEPGAPVLDIPPAAGRILTTRRERGAAEALMRELNSGLPPEARPIRDIEQALTIVRSKGQYLDPDAIPGLDMDAARSDAGMGKSTPATQAVTQAYRQFYGLDGPGGALGPLSDIAAEADMLGRQVSIQRAGPALEAGLRQELADAITEAVDRITGDVEPVDLEFADRLQRVVIPPEHGGDGKRMGTRNGYYDPVPDLIKVMGMLEKPPSQVMETAYHESWHRIQYTLLTRKEMKAFDSVFGKVRVHDMAQLRLAGDRATIEKQAFAFQAYAAARAKGRDASQDQIRFEIVQALDESLPRKDGSSWDGTFRGEAFVRIIQGFDRLLEFIERVNNAVRGRGFTSVQDLYERAWSGELAKSRALDYAAELMTPDQVDRFETLVRWRGDNKAAVSDITAMVVGLDDQINALKSQALAGGC